MHPCIIKRHHSCRCLYVQNIKHGMFELKVDNVSRSLYALSINVYAINFSKKKILNLIMKHRRDKRNAYESE